MKQIKIEQLLPLLKSGWVASGFGEDKEFVLNECFHYLAQYSEKTFKKMTMEIKETEE